MIAYLDSSVLLRVLLNQPGRLAEWDSIERAVSSRLLKAECLRTLDRARVLGGLGPADHPLAVEQLLDALDSVELIEVSDRVLDRVGLSQPVPLGTLDAIHLCSALDWVETVGEPLAFLTHDHELGTAARTAGLKVHGIAAIR